MARTPDYESPPTAPADFDVPETIRNSREDGDPFDEWDGAGQGRRGISGLWFPEKDMMVIDDRTIAHHNVQYRMIHKEFGPIGPMMPWAVGFSMEKVFLDLPSSGGGLYQVLNRLDVIDDVESWRQGSQVVESVLWPVIYTCRLADVPDDTEVTFHHKPSRKMSADPAYSVMRQFDLGAAYTELRFTGTGLPDPRIDRVL